MSLATHDYLPFAVLVFVCLSIRLDRASFRNFLSVTVGALTVWVVSPTHSPWGRTISFGLAALAAAMSPLRPPLVRAIKNLRQSARASGSKSPKLNRALTNPDPITVLHNPPDAEVDIVAVHGLGSSVETTWTHKTSGRLWLRDFLHLDFPKARIMTYRHDSSWKSQALVKDLVDHGRQFLGALEGRRATEESRDRPLILVGHSFGGLLIEQALVLAKGATADPNTQARHECLANSLAGAIFLGTPHAGSGYSLLGKLYCLFNYWEGGNPLLLGYMDPGAKEVVKLEDDFLKYYPRELSFDYHETKLNVILGMQFQMVVERDSGTRRGQEWAPLDTDHFGLNKYHSREDASYIAVKDKMAEMLRSWAVRMEKDKDELDASELELLKNLEPCSFTATVGKRQRDLTPGTCEWVVHHEAFVTWSEESNVLWILGNPGSGKTYIAQWLCEHISRNRRNNLMHFFFDAKNEDAKDLRSLRRFYQTILHQLLEGIRKSRPKLKAQCFRLVRKTILKEGPGETAYVEALRALLHLASPSFLVVDALDECRESDSHTLKEWLAKVGDFPNLKIVITSRSLHGIRKISNNPLYINLQLSAVVDKLDADIERFILDRIKRDGSMFPAEMPRVVEKLKSRSSGMILYARLMLEILEKKVGTEEDLLAEMEQLPGTLTALYADRLNNVRDKKFASSMLQWLVTCRRPLTVGGLRGVEIIGRTVWPENRFELDERDPPKGLGKNNAGGDLFQEYLLRDLLPLVETLDDGSVRLVHTTVSQFLLGEEVEDEGVQCPARFRVDLGASHERIAMTCVTFLRWSSEPAFSAHNPGGSGPLAFLGNKDLREYAVLEWPGHCEKSESKIMVSDGEKRALVAFFTAEKAFSAWLAARAELDSLFAAHFGLDQRKLNPARHPQPLHVAVFFNIWQLGRLFLTDAAINARDATGSTALHISAGQGYPRIVKELLERGARMDIADASGAYPLHRAVRRGNHETLLQLLAADASRTVVNIPDKYKFTPMHVACQLGWTRCVDILLQHHASLANESGAIETPIGLAIENGHTDAVRTLLTHDPSLVEHCRRPLVQAARRGSTDMVKFLCEAGVDTSYEDPLGQTALHKACIFGKVDLVEYLLDTAGAFVDAKDKSQRTPLYFAAERGHLSVVNALLHRNADCNSLDRRQETALFKPAGNGHDDVVDRLLRAGTDATILDAWQRTPLLFAARKGRLNIVRMLLERTQIDQNHPNHVGLTALHSAAAELRETQEGVIDALFEHGADPNARDHTRGTALHAAVCRGPHEPPPPVALLGRLLQQKVPIDARDKYGRTALYCAAANRNVSAVSFLLGAGAAPGGESLHAAVRSGDIALVQPFLEHMSKLDLAERDRRMDSPLHIAAAGGYDDIVAALLAVGAPTNRFNADRRTPREAAEEAKHATTASLLRDADPDAKGNLEARVASFDSSQVNSQDALGRTLMHIAALLGRIDVLPRLIEARADADVRDDIGQTPLHYASQQTDSAMAKALIAAEAKVDVRDALGRVPLYLAAEAGNEAVARVLLAAGAELVASKNWLSPLPAAALAGSAQTVRAFLEHDKGRKQDSDIRTAIYFAAERGHCEVMKELLRQIEDSSTVDALDGKGRSALFMASENGHLEVVRQLIQSGSLVYRTDKDRHMAIHLAAEEGHLEIVRLLLSKLPSQVERALDKWEEALPGWPTEEEYRGQEFIEALVSVDAIVKDAEGPYWSADPSKWATPEERQKLQTGVVSGLRTFDKEPHSISSTTLMRAVKGGHADVVKLLLDEVPEMPLQAQHYSYSNVLSLAASQGYTEIARLLIAAGAEISAITDTQETCLHEAADNGQSEVVELLLQNDANPDLARLRDGYTPLHLAAAKGHESTVRALVRVAFLNAVDDLGRTPLHVACLGGHNAVVDVLVDADADLEARDFDRNTPLELAGDLSEKTKSRMEEQAKRQRQRRDTRH